MFSHVLKLIGSPQLLCIEQAEAQDSLAEKFFLIISPRLTFWFSELTKMSFPREEFFAFVLNYRILLECIINGLFYLNSNNLQPCSSITADKQGMPALWRNEAAQRIKAGRTWFSSEHTSITISIVSRYWVGVHLCYFLATFLLLIIYLSSTSLW